MNFSKEVSKFKKNEKMIPMKKSPIKVWGFFNSFKFISKPVEVGTTAISDAVIGE